MSSASPFLNTMTTTLSSVEFPAGAEALPWLAALWVGVWVLRPIATFIHELGHALPALAFTKAEVEVRIGDSNPSLSEFTINGKRMRGINAHLKLGFVSLKYATIKYTFIEKSP